jgi:hypothetical protein
VISAAENSNKFRKARSWKKKSVENVVTHGPTAQATLKEKFGEKFEAVWPFGDSSPKKKEGGLVGSLFYVS